MRKSVTTGVLGLLTAAVLTVGAVGAATASSAPTEQRQSGRAAVGLTADGKSLVGFDTSNPGRATDPVAIRGLVAPDTKLVGIDFRVQDGMLYGVGDRGGIYTTAPDGRSARKIGQLTIPLEGAAFGVDFNPAANALRIVSDTGQNLRQPFSAMPLPATVADGRLNTPATAPDTGTVPVTGVSGAAYTNNDLGSDTGTTLFDINTANDTVVIQSPANSGTVVATGALGVNAVGDAGFDIYSTVRNRNTTANEAFAVLQVGNTRALYRIDLLTGAATKVGNFRAPVADLAVVLQR